LAVQAAIAKAHKAAGSYRNATQIALILITFHAYKHGDWESGLVKLTSEMPDGVGLNGITKWACKFIGLELVDGLDEKGKKVKKFGKWKGREHIERLFNGDPNSKDKFEKAGAKATMFWEFAEPSPFKGSDFNQNILDAMKERSKMLKLRDDLLTKAADGLKYNEVERAKFRADADKIRTTANEETINSLLKICNFEVIDGKVTAKPAEQPAADAPISSQEAPILTEKAA
jgi:hypothetical protein